VARDVQKMLDLQAIVQSLGVKGRGKHWDRRHLTEKLGELVSGLDDKKIELARLNDRFPQQVTWSRPTSRRSRVAACSPRTLRLRPRSGRSSTNTVVA